MDQKITDRRFGWGSAAVLGLALLSAALGAAVMWFAVQAHMAQNRDIRVHELQSQLLQAHTELADVISQRDMLEGQLAVENSTRRGLETTLQAVQAELGAAHDQMAFFEELLPPGPVGSVSIRGLDIQRKGRTVEYKVLLMRRGASTKPFEGSLQFQASGQLNGEPATIVLHPLQSVVTNADHAADPEVRTLELDFKQFQRSGGLLDLPEGFEPHDVTLNVLEGNTLRVSRTVDLGTPPANG